MPQTREDGISQPNTFPSMPPISPSTGLTITNPLILYRALLATKRIDPDPAQHRLALHLQKLYYRLKDYQPEVDFGHRLDQINRLVKEPALDAAEVEAGEKRNHGRRRGILSTLREQKEKADAMALTRRLTSHESAVQLQSPQGLLLYGEVGTGKSLLVDLLADCLPNRKKRRWHFNTFMLETFARLEQLRKSRLTEPSAMPNGLNQDEEYSLLWLARDMISTSPILFLDEFQLPDRAASKILSNLLTSFFHLGGVLIATSNRMPEELANASGMEFAAPPSSRLGLLGNRWGLVGPRKQGGRSENMFAGKGDFAAFLEVLRARCEIWDMEGGKDWRRREAEDEISTDTKLDKADLESNAEGFEGLEAMASGNWGLGHEQSLHVKASSEEMLPNKKDSKVTAPKHYFVKPSTTVSQEEFKELENAWKASELHAVQSPAAARTSDDITIAWQNTILRVYGRNLLIPRHLFGVTKWSFDELCGTNLGPADYITLASTFHTLILTDVPVLTLLQKNEARRLITLLDALYEARCKLLISAEAGPDDIFFPETKQPPQDGVSIASGDDEIYPETFSEIYQDQTSPFRPNTSSYISSASPPSYPSTPLPSLQSQASSARSILADEDSDFGPVYGSGRSHGPSDGAPGAGNEIGRQSPDFARTGTFTGEDERFAYKRARSRLWEMCGKRWWARDEEGWWRPLAKDVRRWEGAREDMDGQPPGQRVPQAQEGTRQEELFRHGASPFRTSQEAPPKFGWEHAWGVIRWGKRAGAWGKGIEGLGERRKREISDTEKEEANKRR